MDPRMGQTPSLLAKKKKLTKQELLEVIERNGLLGELSVTPSPAPPPPPPSSSPTSQLLTFEEEMEAAAVGIQEPTSPIMAPPPPPPPPPALVPICGPQPSWAGCLFMCHACYFENTDNVMAAPGGRIFITMSLCPRCAKVNSEVNSVIRKNEL